MNNTYKMKCNKCGNEFEYDADSRRIFCTYCGTEHHTIRTRVMSMEDDETEGYGILQNDAARKFLGIMTIISFALMIFGLYKGENMVAILSIAQVILLNVIIRLSRSNTVKSDKQRFILFYIVIVLYVPLLFIGKNAYEEPKQVKKGNKIVWEQVNLSEQIPIKDDCNGDIIYNSDQMAVICVNEMNYSKYMDYREYYKQMGYTINADVLNSNELMRYTAFDPQGNYVMLYFWQDRKQIGFCLENSEELDQFDISDESLGSILPEIRSNVGTIYRDTKEEFFVNVRDIREDEVEEFINKCKEEGFVFSKEADDLCVAMNSEGYEINIYSYSLNRAEIYVKAPQTK